LTPCAPGIKLKPVLPHRFFFVTYGPKPLLTLTDIIHQLAHFTPDQRSLAWSPQPPFESTGAHDCRVGGDCGLDFNRETARARWRQARYRWNREQERLQTHDT
jgi:hypothetical protein